MAVGHLYTKQVAKEVRMIKPPERFHMDIIEYPEFLTLRVREEEIMEFSSEKQLYVVEYLHKVRLLLESYGIRCEFEGLRYHGK